MGIEDVLNEPEAPEVPVETPETPIVEKTTSVRQKGHAKEWEAQGRDPATGEPIKEAKKEEPKKEEPKKEEVPFTDREKAFLARAEDEKKKRQELENRFRQQPQQPQQPPQPAPQPAAEPKTFWDDPEGNLKSFQDKMFTEITRNRLNSAEMVARYKYPDFEEVLGGFDEMLKNTPGLYEKWINAPDPADFAYRTVKSHKELQEAGDIDKLRAKIEKETRIKLEAELKEKAETLA